MYEFGICHGLIITEEEFINLVFIHGIIMRERVHGFDIHYGLIMREKVNMNLVFIYDQIVREEVNMKWYFIMA